MRQSGIWIGRRRGHLNLGWRGNNRFRMLWPQNPACTKHEDDQHGKKPGHKPNCNVRPRRTAWTRRWDARNLRHIGLEAFGWKLVRHILLYRVQSVIMPGDDPARHRPYGQKDNAPLLRAYCKARAKDGQQNQHKTCQFTTAGCLALGEGRIQLESVIEMGTPDFARLVSNERGI